MLLRLVRPVKRTGTSFNHFQQRIPADIRGRAVGMALDVPLGSRSVRIAITGAMTTVRFSLRTRDPHETRRSGDEGGSSSSPVYLKLALYAGTMMG